MPKGSRGLVLVIGIGILGIDMGYWYLGIGIGVFGIDMGCWYWGIGIGVLGLISGIGIGNWYWGIDIGDWYRHCDSSKKGQKKTFFRL